MHYKLELCGYDRILRIGTLPTEILEYIVDDYVDYKGRTAEIIEQ